MTFFYKFLPCIIIVYRVPMKYEFIILDRHVCGMIYNWPYSRLLSGWCHREETGQLKRRLKGWNLCPAVFIREATSAG
jgi:hypothetical protein